jgi:hypothetical protein
MFKGKKMKWALRAWKSSLDELPSTKKGLTGN